jgi:hypothetical protein
LASRVLAGAGNPLVRESVEGGDDTAMLEYARQLGYVGDAEEKPREGKNPER